MRMNRLLTLCFLVVIITSTGCNSDTSDADGDQSPSDGDRSENDGDLTDGDVPDGDLADGDSFDGDIADADLADGDTIDGDMESESEREEEAELIYTCNDPVEARELPYLADETFDLGPYLMQPLQNSIVVMWRTVDEEDGSVLYGLDDNTNLSVSQEGLSNIHEIKLEGLTANTRYSYQVKSGERTSALHHFYTAPDPGQGFSITIWGDSQSNPHIFSQHVDHMAGLKPYFALGVGDHVSEGDEFYQWKERLFGPARGLFHEVAFYAAIGNHARNSQNLYDLYSFPHPEDNPQHESFYSFTYGNAFFLVIDTDKPYFPIGDLDTEISAFVHEQVASPEARRARWRFALGHEPGYAEAWGEGECDYAGALPVRGWLLPLLSDNNFHAYFAGHMHGYERGQNGNLMTLTTGGGGGGLDDWCKDLPEISVVHYVHHHLQMEVGCDTVKISAYDLEGVKFDWLEINADNYGQIIDEGPMDNLPDPPVNPDSPTLDGDQD